MRVEITKAFVCNLCRKTRIEAYFNFFDVLRSTSCVSLYDRGIDIDIDIEFRSPENQRL